MIDPGKLDTPIEIQALTTTEDAYGTPVESYATVAGSPKWAQFIPLRGAEVVEMQKRTAKQTFKLRIRSWADLTPVHQVKVRGMEANILFIENNGRDGDQVVWCEVKA